MIEVVRRAARDCVNAMPPDTPDELRVRLERAIAILGREEIFIAIAGLFKAGKSTLINRVIDWEILPSGDLPETGAPAFLRRKRPRAVRIQQRQGGSRQIDPNPQAIAVETSLYLADGSRRPVDSLARSIEINVPKLRFGPQVVLIDLPGLRDTGEMDKVALKTAMESDLLLWVFRSEPAFSEQDAEFLSYLVSICGPRAVQLAINVISRESDLWPAFQTTRLAVHKTALTKCLGQIGLGQQHVEALIIVDAKRVRYRIFGELFGETFGGKQLFALLQNFSNQNDVQVKQRRLVRIESAICAYRSWLTAMLTEAKQHLREQQTEYNAFQKRIARREMLQAELARLVRAAFDGLHSEIASVAEGAGQRVSSYQYAAYKSVGEPLSSGAASVVVARAKNLASAITSLACDEEALPIDQAMTQATIRAFAFGRNGSTALPDKIIAAGIADEVGSIYTPKPKMSFGRVMSWLKGQDKGVDDAVAQVRYQIQAKAREIVRRTVGQRDSVQAVAVGTLKLVPIGTPPPVPDSARVDRLGVAAASLDRVLTELRQANLS